MNKFLAALVAGLFAAGAFAQAPAAAAPAPTAKHAKKSKHAVKHVTKHKAHRAAKAM